MPLAVKQIGARDGIIVAIRAVCGLGADSFLGD
jgi:hypothetical protein